MRFHFMATLTLSTLWLVQFIDGFNIIAPFIRVTEVDFHYKRSISNIENAQNLEIGLRSKRRHFFSELHATITEENEMDKSNMSEFIEKKPDSFDESVSTDRSTEELVFNSVLLAASFGFALYTVLNIDHGMTRGWTHAEIITRVPFDNWRQYEDSLSEKPIFTKTMINVVIYLLGDWLSQTLFQEKDALDFDASQTLKNGLIGLFFGPIVHQYYQFSDSILPPAIAVNRIYKILMDQTIYLGTKCSVYIAAVGLMSGQSFEEIKDDVKTRIKPVMFTAWKFWPLVHCVTYGVIPARHRILWVNSVDLIWNAILAKVVRSDKEVEAIDDIVSLDSENIISDVENKELDFLEGNDIACAEIKISMDKIEEEELINCKNDHLTIRNVSMAGVE